MNLRIKSDARDAVNYHVGFACLTMSTRLPAEWEPQAAVMLTWPRADGAFASDAANWAGTQRCFEQILSQIARFQPVIVSACTGAEHARLLAWLAQHTFNHPVTLHALPSDDVWARDHGPIGVYHNGKPRLLKFGFDGWGGKYPAQRDNALSAQLGVLGAFGSHPLHPVDLVLEGGAIDSDGAGSVLATRSSILDPRRNPGWTRAQIEARLLQVFGLQRIMWLEQGHLAGDDTDGHIDTLVRFANPHTLLYQASGGAQDINHASLTAMAKELAGLRQSNGQPYHLLALPWPGQHRNDAGEPLPASYANFLILNHAVLLPTYGVSQDEQAIAVLQQAFPQREIVPIDCQALIRQYGSLHCVTMNLPA